MSGLGARQTTLELEMRKAFPTEHSVSKPEATESTADWLQQLRTLVPPAEILKSNE